MRIVVKDKLAELERLVKEIKADPEYYKDAEIVMLSAELREVLSSPRAPKLLSDYFADKAQKVAVLAYELQQVKEKGLHENDVEVRQSLFDRQSELEEKIHSLKTDRNTTNLEVHGISIRTSLN